MSQSFHKAVSLDPILSKLTMSATWQNIPNAGLVFACNIPRCFKDPKLLYISYFYARI
jgi:hypothetical protein